MSKHRVTDPWPEAVQLASRELVVFDSRIFVGFSLSIEFWRLTNKQIINSTRHNVHNPCFSFRTVTYEVLTSFIILSPAVHTFQMDLLLLETASPVREMLNKTKRGRFTITVVTGFRAEISELVSMQSRESFYWVEPCSASAVIVSYTLQTQTKASDKLLTYKRSTTFCFRVLET